MKAERAVQVSCYRVITRVIGILAWTIFMNILNEDVSTKMQ